jgi:aryl-alcohol dehydrogenase-like predicted oxidoreductase
MIPSVMLRGDLQCKRILNGLWQTSGGWGPKVGSIDAVESMYKLFNTGFTTFDGADHYGPAEDLMGMLRDRIIKEGGSAASVQLFTKWCPQPGRITRADVDAAINRSLSRMKTSQLDLLQLHWWDYKMQSEMLQCIHLVNELRKEGKINKIALTNFDTQHVELFLKEGIPIASNQVQYSLIDTRPSQKMAILCKANGVQLLTYGTLCGGLLTDSWLGKPEPKTRADIPTPSLGKYFNMIKQWGTWSLFQTLLQTLRSIADRHTCSIANIAVKWVLDQDAVGGVIIGVRAGLSEHGDDNLKALTITLTDQDKKEIDDVLRKSNDLLTSIGDCGDEYR